MLLLRSLLYSCVLLRFGHPVKGYLYWIRKQYWRESTYNCQNQLSTLLCVSQVNESQQHDDILVLLASTFHCVTRLPTSSQPFSNNLFIYPSNMAFLHPCFPVLIVFGWFILHDDGGGGCCCVDTFVALPRTTKLCVRQRKDRGGR